MKKNLIAVLVFLITHSLSAQNVKSIISKTEAKYLDMKVYLDSGKAISNSYNLDHPISNAYRFKTAYSDDGSYNFESYEIGSGYIRVLNKDSKGVVRAWDPLTNSIKIKPSFEVGLASAGSLLVQLMTIDLLAPGSSKAAAKNVLHTIPDLKLEAPERINGNLCYKLSGTYSLGKINPSFWISHTVWISQKDFLIRKVETDYPVKKFRTKNTFIFFPYTLKTVNKDVFKFKPGRLIGYWRTFLRT